MFTFLKCVIIVLGITPELRGVECKLISPNNVVFIKKNPDWKPIYLYPSAGNGVYDGPVSYYVPGQSFKHSDKPTPIKNIKDKKLLNKISKSDNQSSSEFPMNPVDVPDFANFLNITKMLDSIADMFENDNHTISSLVMEYFNASSGKPWNIDDDGEETFTFHGRDRSENSKRWRKYKVKKKFKKFLLPLLLAYKLKFFALIPVMIGGLVLLAGSTGLAGFFFALFTAVIGLKSETKPT